MEFYHKPAAAQGTEVSSHDAFNQKSSLIVPLDMVLDEELQAYAQQGRHRHVVSDTF